MPIETSAAPVPPPLQPPARSARPALGGAILVLFALAGLGAGLATPNSIALAQGAGRGETRSAALGDGAAALVRGDTGAAIEHYTAALEDPALPKDRRALIFNDRAVAYARIGQTRLAFDDFNRAVQLFPENAAVYNNRGNLLLGLGQTAEAIKDFDRALALAPGYAAAYNNRAGAYMSGGDLRSAIRDYTQAVKLLPTGAAPLNGRGTAHLSLGHPHAAIRDFTRAVSSDQSFASGYYRRAEARMAIGEYAEAIEDLSRAIAFDLKNADMYLLRGRAYFASDNAEAAITDLSRAIELRPSDASAFAERGLAHARNGLLDEGLADLARAIEIDPRSARAFAYRAIVYKEASQADVGTRDIATAVKLSPDAPEVLWAKAEIEETMGQREEAIADLRRALVIDPSLKSAADLLDRLDGNSGSGETPVPNLGFGDWSVVLRGKQYFAVHSQIAKLRVPLEPTGEGEPKLIGYEERPSPLRHIGVLYFSGGKVPGLNGPEDTELAAVIDLATPQVIGIEPHKQGDRSATWTWADDRVTVAAVDGATDQLMLRDGRSYARGSGYRRYDTGEDGQWGRSQYAQPRREARQVPRRKSKTLFDLLFNN